MGSKKLKAVSVIASERAVPVADPERLQWLYRSIAKELRGTGGMGQGTEALKRRLNTVNEQLQKEGGGRARVVPCTANCPTPCRLELTDVQGCSFRQKWSGGTACVSNVFRGLKDRSHPLYDWDLGLRRGFELNMHANRLGLNHWDILVGMVPWLRSCEHFGLLSKMDGRPLDWNSSDFWVGMLNDMAYRQGMGDALAEGGFRAASLLNLGPEIVRRYYTGWGFSGHWDGHATFLNKIVYPFWIVGAVHWAMDTRDPASNTHDYVQNVMYWGPFGDFFGRDEPPVTWDQMRGIGQRLYGRSDTLDPLSGYEGKAIPAAYHGVRSVMKDCLPADDQVFPLIYDMNTEDRFFRIDGIDGPDVDAHLFRAGTGVDWGPAEFTRTCERILNLERANVVRHWARDRKMDERVLPSFEYDENWINPEIGERKALDREQFDAVMDEYYRLRGWGVETGWPTRERLESLGLHGVYEEMIAGATRASERLPELPPVRPVEDIHKDDPDRIEVEAIAVA
ncbi:MAG: hypothetical protein A2Y73_04300 [Chloroflexi bacterium RBG_13_56_8]|nr:MAG: hypothetical protein A2Y73_04300 [Chloroflexi bacterium RBG_13_56_8]